MFSLCLLVASCGMVLVCIEKPSDVAISIYYDIDTNNVRWYFVLQDCSSLKYDNTKFLQKHGIKTPYMYYLHDENPIYNAKDNDDYYWNLAQYVFGEDSGLQDISLVHPYVFIVNPQGKLKMEWRKYPDGKLLLGNFNDLKSLLYAQEGSELVLRKNPVSITSLDFNSADTTDLSNEKYYYHRDVD